MPSASDSTPDEAMPKPTASLTPNIEEIDRRAAAASESVDGRQATFDRVEAAGADPPFELPDQKVVVYSVSHVGFPPIAKDPHNPAVRLYGLFETPEDARAYAGEVAAADPTCSVLLGAAHSWILAAKEPGRYVDAAYTRDKLERIAREHAALRARSTAEFEENRREQRTGGSELATEETIVPPAARETRTEKHARRLRELEEEGRRASLRLPGTLTVEGQAFAVVSFVKDITPEVQEGRDDPEFAMRVYAAFATEADADRYVRNVAADLVTDHALDVVAMRRWLYPEDNSLEDEVSVVYRQSELTNVMQRRAAEKGEVARFRASRAKEGDAVEITDIDPDNSIDVWQTQQHLECEAALFGSGPEGAEGEAGACGEEGV